MAIVFKGYFKTNLVGLFGEIKLRRNLFVLKKHDYTYTTTLRSVSVTKVNSWLSILGNDSLKFSQH